MRRIVAIALALVINGWLLAPEGHAERQGATATARAGQGGSSSAGPSRTFGTRDIRTFNAQKFDAQQQAAAVPYQGTRPQTLEKTARAAVFAKGVRAYYPASRPNQSQNSNVVDPKSLCVPGRRALLQR